MYCWYLRNTYLENKLRVPGATSALGVPVDFGKIDLPAYVLATREDHIVPWRTAYETTQLISGEKRFVLGASGHVAGVINPASKNKRSYWTGDSVPAKADDWLAGAAEKPGSWWNDWSEWLSRHGGGRIKARSRLGSTEHAPLEPAPGSYVKHRIA
jgi:polyhydroxyalkanoate synthase